MAWVALGFGCGVIGTIAYGGFKGTCFGFALTIITLAHANIVRNG